MILSFQKSISNVMQMPVVGEIPAEKMRPYISKTIYMSIAHYSPVLNVIAAQLWMNSWNNKIHGVAVTGSCSYFMLALLPLYSSPASKSKKRLCTRKGGGGENSERALVFSVLSVHYVQRECATLVPLNHLYKCIMHGPVLHDKLFPGN